MSERILPRYDVLAHAVAVDGAAAHTDALRGLAATAYAAGVSPALVRIVTDRDQPEVARERALGRILAQLDRPYEPATRRRIASAA